LEYVIPELIITDIIMPDMDGIELIRKIREKDNNIKILAMSGGGRIKPDLYLEIASKLKADNIIKKPFKKDELLGKVSSLLLEN
jgi:DNA-binding response OmpR family regulator